MESAGVSGTVEGKPADGGKRRRENPFLQEVLFFKCGKTTKSKGCLLPQNVTLRELLLRTAETMTSYPLIQFYLQYQHVILIISLFSWITYQLHNNSDWIFKKNFFKWTQQRKETKENRKNLTHHAYYKEPLHKKKWNDLKRSLEIITTQKSPTQKRNNKPYREEIVVERDRQTDGYKVLPSLKGRGAVGTNKKNKVDDKRNKKRRNDTTMTFQCALLPQQPHPSPQLSKGII